MTDQTCQCLLYAALCAALILECGEDAIIEVITELYLSKEISVLNVIFKLLVLVFHQ